MNTPPHPARRWRTWLPLIAILCVAVWLRAPQVWRARPLAVDEALFASYARQISHENNPLLLGLAVDKPPLLFYAVAASFKLLAPSGMAARLPNFFASVVSIALVAALARRLYKSQPVALLAALLIALSPFDIAYAGTVFTDPLATCCIIAACLAAANERWTGAGILAGLAFATRQSALQFVPLVLALGVVNQREWNATSLLRFGLALAAVCALPFLWGAARGPESPDWWALGVANNNPGRLIRSGEVQPRLAVWLDHLGTVAHPALLLGAGGIGLPLLFTHLRRGPHREVAVDLVLLIYTLGYLIVYWLVAFNTYARYLHTLVPVIALLVARALTSEAKLLRQFAPQQISRHPGIAGGLAAGLIILSMGPGALATRHDSTLLHRETALYADLPAAAAYLNTLPAGTIVYDHWLGWLLGWHTGQNRPPGMWLRITYYPTPEALAADAVQQPDLAPRYFITPTALWHGPWLRALDEAGFAPEVAAAWPTVTIYRLEPP